MKPHNKFSIFEKINIGGAKIEIPKLSVIITLINRIFFPFYKIIRIRTYTVCVRSDNSNTMFKTYVGFSLSFFLKEKTYHPKVFIFDGKF